MFRPSKAPPLSEEPGQMVGALHRWLPVQMGDCVFFLFIFFYVCVCGERVDRLEIF